MPTNSTKDQKIRPKIHILDEVSCHLEDFPGHLMRQLREAFSYPVKGAFMTAACQMGVWDGKECFISDENFAYVHMIPKILDISKRLGVFPKIQDLRDYDTDLVPDFIGVVREDFLFEETGLILRDYQTRGINTALVKKKGTLKFATNAGKVMINVGLGKALDPYIRTLSIVPNQHLADDTATEMGKTSLAFVNLSSKVKKDQRSEKIREARHVIVTKKLFTDNPDLFREYTWALVVDEVHIFGEQMANVLRYDMGHCPIRIGMTGTYPKDKRKAALITMHMGGDVLDSVSNTDLISRGFSSVPDIRMIRTVDREYQVQIESIPFDEFEDKGIGWQMEFDYLTENKGRMKALVDYLLALPKKNTLLVCYAQVAKKLHALTGFDHITQETPVKERKACFHKFRDRDDYFLLGSHNTSSTGISENRIHRVILLDIGKDETLILQSIGRGLRKDGSNTVLEVLDIYNDSKYGRKHAGPRKKIYKREGFDFLDSDDRIIVKHST